MHERRRGPPGLHSNGSSRLPPHHNTDGNQRVSLKAMRAGLLGRLDQDYAYCQAVQRTYGVSYYFAARFFPPETRRAVYALYGFVRYPDQWVDNPDEVAITPNSERASEAWKAQTRTKLDAYERDLVRALHGEPVDLPPCAPSPM